MKQFAIFILRILGWKVDFDMPPEYKRSVVIAAPHTSNWDFFMVRLAFWALRVPMKVAIKDDWTKFPFGLIIKPMGGVGVNRSPKKEGEKRKSQVEAMAELFDRYDEIALVIAPEGTRKLAKNWKMGFYWIAKEAGVPITCGYLDYKRKVAGIGPLVINSVNKPEEELPLVMEFYKNIPGRNHEQFQIDKRYAS